MDYFKQLTEITGQLIDIILSVGVHYLAFASSRFTRVIIGYVIIIIIKTPKLFMHKVCDNLNKKKITYFYGTSFVTLLANHYKLYIYY